MTILSVAQDVCRYAGISNPGGLFGSTLEEHVELIAVANRAADYITKAYDWQVLTSEHVITGNGTLTDHLLPPDFDRFTMDSRGEASIHTPIMVGPMVRIPSLDDWLRREVRDIGRLTYSWILYGGSIKIKPALPNAATAHYFYQSKWAVNEPSTGTNKPAFTADADVFRLDERMLMLCMLWMWRHSKGQSYAQYQQEFEKRKAECARDDKGPRSISYGSTFSAFNGPVAYPFELS